MRHKKLSAKTYEGEEAGAAHCAHCAALASIRDRAAVVLQEAAPLFGDLDEDTTGYLASMRDTPGFLPALLNAVGRRLRVVGTEPALRLAGVCRALADEVEEAGGAWLVPRFESTSE